MTPIGSRHAACVRRLNHLLVRALGDLAIVSAQNPTSIPPHSEPQPEVMVLRPRPDFYAKAHPEPGDVPVVVEVFRRPGAGGYGDLQRRERGDRLGCEAFPDVVLTVDDVLGPRS